MIDYDEVKRDAMNIVQDGTPYFSGSSLCLSCREGQRLRGIRQDEDIMLCHSRGKDPMRINHVITQCSDYDNKNTPPIWEMTKIAWRFSVDDKHRVAGFLDPKGYRKKYGDDGDGRDDF